MGDFQPRDYIENAALILANATPLMSLTGTWTHLRDGLLPTLSSEDRCEAIMPMHLEFGASPSSTAHQSKVKPTGKVDLTFACIFQDRVVFLSWSGLFRLKYELTTIKYSDVHTVRTVDFRYKMLDMRGCEIIATDRLRVLGNDPNRYDKKLLDRWNNLLVKRLTGEWEPIWADGDAAVEQWAPPTESITPAVDPLGRREASSRIIGEL